MLRLLAIIAACYLIYRWLVGSKRKKRPPEAGRTGPGGAIEEEMVQDPFCGAYFPKSQGFPAKVDGRRLLFCSQRCRDKYLERYQARDKD
jgi:hypothetical protein